MKHKYRLQVVFCKNNSFYTASCKYAVHWDIMAFFGKACNFILSKCGRPERFPQTLTFHTHAFCQSEGVMDSDLYKSITLLR